MRREHQTRFGRLLLQVDNLSLAWFALGSTGATLLILKPMLEHVVDGARDFVDRCPTKACCGPNCACVRQ